jgi:pimeloyl-ACP methyl ester carboxylesterase
MSNSRCKTEYLPGYILETCLIRCYPSAAEIDHAGRSHLGSPFQRPSKHVTEGLGRPAAKTLDVAGQNVERTRILPISTSGPRTAKLISGARLVVIEGGPHCIPWTHAQEVNAELLKFLGAKASSAEKAA